MNEHIVSGPDLSDFNTQEHEVGPELVESADVHDFQLATGGMARATRLDMQQHTGSYNQDEEASALPDLTTGARDNKRAINKMFREAGQPEPYPSM